MSYFFFQMSSNLSLRSLLDNEKLKGPNFDSWYRRLRIILEHERILYVITDQYLKSPLPMHGVRSETLTRSGFLIGLLSDA